MRHVRNILFAAAAGLAVSVSGALADDPYTAAELLAPCMEADNDARWGEYAETECEQYIIGYIGALEVTGMTGQDHNVCLPDQNRADEVRWAFMRWINEDYSRRNLTAADAMMSTLKAKFACGGGQAGMQ